MKQAWYYNMTWLNNPQNNPVATNCGHTCVQGSPQADSFPTVSLLWFKDTRTPGPWYLSHIRAYCSRLGSSLA